MKVLHVYRGYYPDLAGGVLEVMRQVAYTTRQLGVSTQMFVLAPHPIPEQIERPEATIFRSRSWLAPASCDLGGVEAFRRFRALAQSVDLLHFHYPWPFADLMYLACARDVPAVVTYHSDVVRQRAVDRAYGPLRRRFLNRMRAVIATSPAYRETSEVLRSLEHPDRIVTIPLGLDETTTCVHEETAREPWLDDLLAKLGGQPFFLFVGVLRYYKGLKYLISAARQSKTTVVIAGAGPERAELESLAHGASNIHFVGAISESAKYALIKRSVGVVLPSHLRSEAFGVSLIESAMCGRPMISCEIGTGTSFVNQHLQTGLVVPPADSVALSQALLRLAGDSELRERLGRQARRHYEQNFSGPALGQASRGLYENVLAGRPPGTGLSLS